MQTKKLNVLLILLFLSSSCRESKLKTERTTGINQTFFEEKLTKAIKTCRIIKDTVWIKSDGGQISTSSFKHSDKIFLNPLLPKDTLFIKPTDRFNVYFVLEQIRSNQLTFNYESQFNYSTFKMRKQIFDTGVVQISCLD